MTAKRGDIQPTAFRRDSNAAPSIPTGQPLWKRMTAEHETLSGGQRNTRWLLDESNRLLALSRELRHHSAALSHCLTELLKSSTAAAGHDAKRDALFEICRSSMALINDARATRQAATTGRARSHAFAEARRTLTSPAPADPAETGTCDGHDDVGSMGPSVTTFARHRASSSPMRPEGARGPGSERQNDSRVRDHH